MNRSIAASAGQGSHGQAARWRAGEWWMYTKRAGRCERQWGRHGLKVGGELSRMQLVRGRLRWLAFMVVRASSPVLRVC